MDDIIIHMQTTIDRHEMDIVNLSDELYTQQKEVAKLRDQLAQLEQRLKSLADEDYSAQTELGQEPPPPHY